jgi:hypothetical protein
MKPIAILCLLTRVLADHTWFARHNPYCSTKTSDVLDSYYNDRTWRCREEVSIYTQDMQWEWTIAFKCNGDWSLEGQQSSIYVQSYSETHTAPFNHDYDGYLRGKDFCYSAFGQKGKCVEGCSDRFNFNLAFWIIIPLIVVCLCVSIKNKKKMKNCCPTVNFPKIKSIKIGDKTINSNQIVPINSTVDSIDLQS